MPLNAVQLYVKDNLQGLQFPLTQQQTLNVLVKPPNPENFDRPLAHVWGGVSKESRRTMNKPFGDKAVLYDVDVWVYYAEVLDDPLSDSLFPIIIDTITAKLRTLKQGVYLTDQVTGTQSRLVNIGEDIKVDYAPARSAEGEQLIIYMARIIVNATEWVTG